MLTLKTLFSRSTVFKPTTSAYKIRSRSNVTTHQQRPLAQSISGANPFNLNPTISSTFNGEPETYDYYAGIRIYRSHSWYDLTNVILMTTACNNDFFVSNCHKIYEMSHKVLGSTLTEFAVANTMGRIYTSGGSLQEMSNFIQNWRHPGVNILMSFSNEAPAHLVNTRVLDENARAYADSVNLCSTANQVNNAMALKCSSLCLLSTLKNSNKAQLELRSIFSSGFADLSQKLTAKEIEDLFRLRNIQFTFPEFQEFMTLFLNKEVTQENLDHVTVTKFDWLRDMHMYYVNDAQKNKNKILRQLAKLEQEDMEELERFAERLKLIFERGHALKQRILVDAEQSYMQFTIDSFAVQFSNIYNQESAIILNTFQNYLKSTKDRILYELERTKSLGLPFGVKMVRGAYMVEERRLAKEQGYEDPIQPTIEDTHNNYNSNLELLISNWAQNSQVLIASHNEHSVKWGKYLVKKYDINHTKGFLSFAQLLGLGDHLTFSLSKEGYTVGKMCHFGPLPYMVPFLIRRAQESRQVLASSALKRRLAFNEISQRIRFTSN